jgi:hypothetical protein
VASVSGGMLALIVGLLALAAVRLAWLMVTRFHSQASGFVSLLERPG